MKKHLLLLALLSIATISFSQGPPPPPPWMNCIILNSQAEVDSFPINFPNETVITECLEIVGLDITNLDSLYQITEIYGDLYIGFSGTCWPPPCGNVLLENLTGLSNLEILSGSLSLSNNAILSDLAGLENLNYDSLSALYINGNPELSICNIESICGYITLDESDINIANNQQGCNSEVEVELACGICPEGVWYSEQWQIDSFPVWYPYCENIVGDFVINYTIANNVDSLYSIKSIGGNLWIQSTHIQNLDGLSQLESASEIRLTVNTSMQNINGLSNLQSLDRLFIMMFESLDSISAFSNIESLEHLYVEGNGLQSLDGLQNISGHVEYLKIFGNEFINNYTGLGPITSIGTLVGGPEMENFEGLDSLKKIGTLDIWGPDYGFLYESLTGLENVDSLTGDLWIKDNPNLLSLEPLNGILLNDSSSIHIFDNEQLSTCDVDFICERIVSMPESLEIYSNAEGCNDLLEIEEECNECPSGFISFNSQEQIDLFPFYYPNCTEFDGWLWISGPDITNVDSLIQLTSVGLLDIGAFDVGNPLLENIDGLSNLTDIGGYLGLVENDILSSLEPLSNVTSFSTLIIIDNDNLTNLEGLENTFTTEQFIIRSNDALENLDALENINVMNQYVSIEDNSALSNLDGLLNVVHTSPDSLFIKNNANLTTCNNAFICDFVNDFPEQAIIEENADGCASVSEVLLSCGIGVGIDEVVNERVSIYPNPAKDILYIASKANIRSIHLFDALGQKMPLPNETTINVSQLPQGIYIIEIETDIEIFRKRLLIE